MAGKAYNMREMKAIVEYLTEHKAYSEVKGRKMWMEFANSQKTTRTWQSLKETFIKRILPDIHNPYYKLTMDQIRSFQQGCDVVNKERRNRLDLQPTSEDSGNDSKVEDPKETTTKNAAEASSTKTSNENNPIIIDLDDEVEKVTGEVTSAKICSRNRSSEETVVLENCYQNAEELQRDLESPHVKERKTTFKDLIMFEPMTPAVRSVLEDFETESESSDKDAVLKIDEDNPQVTVEDSENNPIENTPTEQVGENQDQVVTDPNECEPSKNNPTVEEITANENETDEVQETNKPSNVVEAMQNGDANEKGDIDQQVSDVTSTNQNANDIVSVEKDDKIVDQIAKTSPLKEKNKTSENSIQISGNTTSDTLLPNNQEGLDSTKNTQVEKLVAKKITKSPDRKGQKRSSKDSLSDGHSKKQKLPDKPDSEIVVETVILSDTPMVDVNRRKSPESKQANGSTNKNNTTNSEHIFDALLESNLNDAINNDLKGAEEKSAENQTSQDINPCLQSVSLFDEQFKNTRYSNSDSDDEATSAPRLYLEVESPGKKDRSPKNLKSNLREGNSKDAAEAKDLAVNKNKILMQTKLQKERALANLFGFANGGAATSRKRKLSHKRSSQHRRRLSKPDSNSSEWSSESDDEDYVSPPYGRHTKHTRKLLKPKSCRVLQDPEQGRLYVMFGKKLYPVVKYGKHVKNFVTYTSDSDSAMGGDESFWKQKYLEEKKKVADIRKAVKDIQQPESSQAVHPNTPPQSPPHKKAATTHTQKAIEISKSKDEVMPQREVKESKEKLVLKLETNNGARIHMEGAWTQISTAMPQMMQLLNNQATNCPSGSVHTLENGDKMADRVEISSGVSTPVINAKDTDVHEKVNRIEKEIFKEIEEKDKEEQISENEQSSSNVTRRKARPRVSSSSSSIILNPRKIQKTDNADANNSKQNITENDTNNIKKQHTPRQAAKREIKAKPSPVASTSKQSEMNSKQSEIISKQSETNSKQSETNSKQSETNSKQSETSPKQAETNSKRSERLAKRGETALKNSETAKQSDNQSPTKLNVPIQPRRQSLRLSKTRESVSSTNTDKIMDRPVRRVVTPRKYEIESSNESKPTTRRSATKERVNELDINFDEENVRFKLPSPAKNRSSNKKTQRSNKLNSSIKKDIHAETTYGYQDSDFSPIKIDLSKRKRRLSLSSRSRYKNKRTSRRFSQPTPLIPAFISLDSNSSYFVPFKRTQSTLNSSVYRSDSIKILLPKRNRPVEIIEPVIENSAEFENQGRYFDMSEKQSKETSIVGESSSIVGESSSISLPISPELSVVENLSINKHLIDKADHPTLNEMMSEGSKMDFNEYTMKGVDVSMPLMNQLCELKQTKQATTAKRNRKKTENLTLSESLDQRLQNLLLESTKKAKTAEENAMDIDISNLVTEKKKGKKRCSTPRRKKNIGTSRPSIDAIIEEHTETFSSTGRKSCPPAITFKPMDENATNCDDVVLKKRKPVPRKKKDVIKVKIQRPKSKTSHKRSKLSDTNVTVGTDSGIIDAEASGLFKGSESSVEINHNHSETCMKFNDCAQDSVELLENMESVITVNSSVPSELDLDTLLNNTAWYPSELTENAQYNADMEQKQSEELASPESVYYTPSAVNCSLITEDLSNSPQKATSNWHLFSEDENTKTQPPIYSNLNKIFPVMCAVPDLSTITEASKDNEDSRNLPSKSVLLDNK